MADATTSKAAGETASSLELKPETSAATAGGGEGEAELLVSEFPPPPYYYSLASKPGGLEPPPIPTDALKIAAKKAASLVAEAEPAAEAEQFASLGIIKPSTDDATESKATASAVIQDKDLEGDVVAVFSEIVEDPVLFEVQDECEDPTLVRDRLKE